MQPLKGLNKENLQMSHLNQKPSPPLLPSHRTTWSPWTRSKRGERQKHEPALDPEVWRKQHHHQLWHWIQEQVWYASWNMKIIFVLFFLGLISNLLVFNRHLGSHVHNQEHLSNQQPGQHCRAAPGLCLQYSYVFIQQDWPQSSQQRAHDQYRGSP